jgi:hypothetical protein
MAPTRSGAIVFVRRRQRITGYRDGAAETYGFDDSNSAMAADSLAGDR